MTKKLTNDQKLEMLRSLKRVINTRSDRRPRWFEAGFGLCTNFALLCDCHPSAKDIVDHSDPFKHFFFKHVKTWPHYSGDADFYVPVPSSPLAAGFDAETMYCRQDNQYDRRSPYCRLRYDLLDHVIACVEAEGA